MELRSTRSRSITPFLVESFDKEIVEKGNHVERTVVRTTRRTVRTNEAASSSTDEVTSYETKPSRRSARGDKIVKEIYKTSDYSSEEGENEVTSTRTISQSERKQLIEDAKAASNGHQVSALDLYKKSGRYWDVYPKTDWTYSEHSKDRVELAPGVVAMPNMSRKTIHSVSDLDTLSYSDFLHKETNTESSLTQSNSYASSASAYTGHQPRKLFNNNYEYKYDRYEKSITTSWMKVKRTVVRFFTSILSIFYYTFEVQASWFAKLHNFTSWVMLLDTWLLWKSHSGNKPMKLVALCLVPLLLLGGFHILLASGISLAPSCHPNCGHVISTYFNSFTNAIYKFFNLTKT